MRGREQPEALPISAGKMWLRCYFVGSRHGIHSQYLLASGDALSS
jgi:hypothetical protein